MCFAFNNNLCVSGFYGIEDRLTLNYTSNLTDIDTIYASSYPLRDVIRIKHDSYFTENVCTLVKAKFNKPVSPHSFRHYFAIHLLEARYNIKNVQELLGPYKCKNDNDLYQVLNRTPKAVRSHWMSDASYLV